MAMSAALAVLAKGAAADPGEIVRAIISAKLADPVVRTAFYAAILGVRLRGAGHHHLSEAVASCGLDLANARVLRLDAERTRQELEGFRSDEVKLRMNKLMTFYSKAASTPYRQGLNEVLAPIMTLRQLPTSTGDLGDLPDGAVYSMLQRLVATFLSAAYSADDGEFVALQCSLQFVRLLLLFHEPQLARVLDQHGVTPELFATPWLVTLFARGLPLEVVFEIWDTLLVNVLHVGDTPPSSEGAPIRCPVYAGPGLVHFLCIALLKRHAAEIKAAVEGGDGAGSDDFHTHGLKTAELSILISKLTLRTPADAREVLQSAVDMAACTPNSVRKALLDAAYADTAPPQATLAELEASVCVRVAAAEALARAASAADLSKAASASPAGAGADAAAADFSAETSPHAVSSGPPALLIIDCRPMAEFGVSHIRGSFHLSPDIVSDPAMLTAMADAFSDLTSFHFAVLGGGDAHAELDVPDHTASSSRAADRQTQPAVIDAAHVVVLFLLNRGFSHVCEVRGGFQAVLRAARSSEALAARLMTSEDSSLGASSTADDAADESAYDDGSDDGSDQDEDPDLPESPGAAAASARSGKAALKDATESPRLSAAGRAARALRRLSQRPPRPATVTAASATAATARSGLDVEDAAALAGSATALAAPRRRSRVNSLRSWLSGNAAPNVVYTSESVTGSPVGSDGTAVPVVATGKLSEAKSSGDAHPRPRAGTGASASGRSLSTEISAGTPVEAGLFAGLHLARQRATSELSVGLSKIDPPELPAAAASKSVTVGGAASSGSANRRSSSSSNEKAPLALQTHGLMAEAMTEDAALDAQLDALIGPRGTGEEDSLEAGDRGEGGTDTSEAVANAAASSADSAPAAATALASANDRPAGRGWRDALASAAATVSSLASQAAAAPTSTSGVTGSAGGGARRSSVLGAGSALPGVGAGGAVGSSFADASADVDVLDSRLAAAFAGSGPSSARPGEAPAEAAAHFHLEADPVDKSSGEALVVPAGCAVVGSERQWLLRPRVGAETLIRLVGCRRVFADKSVVRRVVLLTPKWLCLLDAVQPGSEEASASSRDNPAGSSLFGGWARRAMSIASSALDRRGATVRLRIDLVFPASALKKLGGKKGVTDLAIMELTVPAHDGMGSPSTSRVVLLCDAIRDLVSAIRASRR